MKLGTIHETLKAFLMHYKLYGIKKSFYKNCPVFHQSKNKQYIHRTGLVIDVIFNTEIWRISAILVIGCILF